MEELGAKKLLSEVQSDMNINHPDAKQSNKRARINKEISVTRKVVKFTCKQTITNEHELVTSEPQVVPKGRDINIKHITIAMLPTTLTQQETTKDWAYEKQASLFTQ